METKANYIQAINYGNQSKLYTSNKYCGYISHTTWKMKLKKRSKIQKSWVVIIFDESC